VVGAPNSSNSKRLVEVALKAGAKTLDPAAARSRDRLGCQSATSACLGVSAGASAPEVVVNEIIDAFRERFDATIELAETVKETENFPGQPRAS
jgi:4-hydroxy-3-methylbut-2-enyl diphosphate reductase